MRLRWYDPTTGGYAVISAGEAQTAGRAITYPSAHGDGTADYVLVVDLASLSGGIVATEVPDVAAIVGVVSAPAGSDGAISVGQAPDTAAIVGVFTGGPITGRIVAVEIADIAILVGNIPGAPAAPSGPLQVTVSATPTLDVTVTQP